MDGFHVASESALVHLQLKEGSWSCQALGKEVRGSTFKAVNVHIIYIFCRFSSSSFTKQSPSNETQLFNQLLLKGFSLSLVTENRQKLAKIKHIKCTLNKHI